MAETVTKVEAPPVEVERITKVTLNYLKDGKMPQAFCTTYQVACAVAVLYNTTALGEMMESLAHYLARVFAIINFDIEPWAAPIGEVVQAVAAEAQKLADAKAAGESPAE